MKSPMHTPPKKKGANKWNRSEGQREAYTIKFAAQSEVAFLYTSCLHGRANCIQGHVLRNSSEHRGEVVLRRVQRYPLCAFRVGKHLQPECCPACVRKYNFKVWVNTSDRLRKVLRPCRSRKGSRRASEHSFRSYVQVARNVRIKQVLFCDDLGHAKNDLEQFACRREG